MARGKSDQNVGILEYALQHLEKEQEEIQGKIDHIRRQLGNRVTASSAAPAAGLSASAAPAARKKRVLSEAARKRIAAAQKRRWAEHRKQGKAAKAVE